MSGEGTTIWSDKTTKSKLERIADAQERSMAAQVRFMVDREYQELRSKGMIVEKPINQEIEEE